MREPANIVDAGHAFAQFTSPSMNCYLLAPRREPGGLRKPADAQRHRRGDHGRPPRRPGTSGGDCGGFGGGEQNSTVADGLPGRPWSGNGLTSGVAVFTPAFLQFVPIILKLGKRRSYTEGS